MTRKKNRREFVKGVALAAAAPLAMAGTDAAVLAAGEDPPKDPRALTAQALAQVVRARFGKHLSEAQLKSIQQTIAQHQLGAEAMKRVRLENGDEPAFIFSAD